MRLLFLVLLIIPSIFGGCAKEQHIDKGDDLLLKLGQTVASMSKQMAEQDPAYLPMAIKADLLVPELKEHAAEPVGTDVVNTAMQVVTTGLDAYAGGGLVATVLALGGMAYKSYRASKMTDLVKQVADEEPVVADATLKRAKIRV